MTQVKNQDGKMFLRFFTTDINFYKTFFPLLLVINLQQLAALAVNMADTPSWRYPALPLLTRYSLPFSNWHLA